MKLQEDWSSLNIIIEIQFNSIQTIKKSEISFEKKLKQKRKKLK
jgi:hypothetical protein